MISGRIAMFAGGVVAGVWASIKARRLAYRLSAPGLVDQVAAWRQGLREFRTELDTGMAARRAQQLQRLGAHLEALEAFPPTSAVPSVTTLEEGPRGDS
jgi:hypothetical protein